MTRKCDIADCHLDGVIHVIIRSPYEISDFEFDACENHCIRTAGSDMGSELGVINAKYLDTCIGHRIASWMKRIFEQWERCKKD